MNDIAVNLACFLIGAFVGYMLKKNPTDEIPF